MTSMVSMLGTAILAIARHTGTVSNRALFSVFKLSAFPAHAQRRTSPCGIVVPCSFYQVYLLRVSTVSMSPTAVPVIVKGTVTVPLPSTLLSASAALAQSILKV